MGINLRIIHHSERSKDGKCQSLNEKREICRPAS